MSTSAFTFVTSKAVVARTLAAVRSLQAVGALDGSRCFVLCLDHEAYQIMRRATREPKVLALTIADLPEVAEFAGRPISRFAVTCKPYLLRWAVTNGGVQKAVYFDSDIWFVADPSFMFDELEENNILLIPAVMTPEATIKNWSTLARVAQRTGYYNAGCVAVNDQALDFLDWWANRCAYSTFRDFYEDISGDQKYLNWVPSLFSKVRLMRHYGLNIKPWLTKHVPLERHADGLAYLNGDPLIFFHFSQNLGNLRDWPEAFFPEVSRYLEDLEQARVDTGLPYVDMAHRDNADLIRPLLPRAGKQAKLIKMIQGYRKPFDITANSARAVAVRGTRALPRSAQKWMAKSLLSGWHLDGDARLSAFDDVITRLSGPAATGPVMSLGISRLAVYLAYLGYPVEVYEPFQGHFNAELNELFNPQWEQAQAMSKRLGVGAQLTFERVPVTDANRGPAPQTLIISARRTPDDLRDTLAAVLHLPTLKHVIVVFNPKWPEEYRKRYQTCIQQLLGQRSVSLEYLGDLDLYRIR